MTGHLRMAEMARGIRVPTRYLRRRWRVLLVGIGLLAGGQVLSARAPDASEHSLHVASLPADAAHSAETRRPRLSLSSRGYVVVDGTTGEVLLGRDEDEPRSIASITKLMSAMVYLDLNPDLSEVIEVAREDRRGARPAHTRLQPGWKLTAEDLLHAALIASENPAVESLVRSTGLIRPEFVGLMNRKAQQLGMTHSIFFDASGLDANNTASPRDVARMLAAAEKYPLIAQITRLDEYTATLQNGGRKLHYVNSNRLARSSSWDVVTGKTGYISDAGYCLAVSANTSTRRLQMVFLGANARLSRFGDAARVVSWLESADAAVASRE